MTLKETKNIIYEIKNRHFLFFDLLVVSLAPFLALFIRLEGVIPERFIGIDLVILSIILLIVKLAIFYLIGLYNRLWKTAGIDEVIRIIFAAIIIIIFETLIIYVSRSFQFSLASKYPLSLPILDTIITISFVLISRFGIKMLENVNLHIRSSKSGKNVIILGAGQTGNIVRDEMLLHPTNGKVVGFLDDDLKKVGFKINGIPVLGTTNEIEYFTKKFKVSKVIIAMAAASGKKIQSVHNVCTKLNLELLTIPSMYSIVSNKINFSSIKKVNMEDLLRRESVQTNIEQLTGLLKNKVVFISGAGGSIGSEIVRQVMKFKPKKIILFGKGENSIYEIQQEILSSIERASEIIIPIIGDVRNKKRIDSIFNIYKPDIVFHAAAHKHVPLMENNIEEAITNNVLGTKNLVTSSSANNVAKFILISTDKAVNPTSIMGVSKRIAELIVLREADITGFSYSAVRFGNVLGSRGSVVGAFKKQIANGGPVEVTHKDIKRYFMTIPEAVHLVLQASILNRSGEIFVLDMGEPIKIVDLAKDMIRFSGLKYKDDIDIVFTGLRPGEKLFEELFLESENFEQTSHEMIYTTIDAKKNGNPIFHDLIKDLITRAKENNGDDISFDNVIKELVPEYQYSNNKKRILN